MKVQQIGVTVE
uniref:Uncharacterized protein n=1 Tax=Rhizophora mucronata TaxID=61149 RepID=A0A2P2IPC6_RHIMU